LQLIAALDPETAMHQLGPALQAMADSVIRFGGVVNRTQGDGIMALFGAPTACEDHAVRACLAARAMIDAVANLSDPNLAIRVGLDSGDVVVFPTGHDDSDYDASGVTAHVAHRMENLAAPGTVLLTERTARLARGYVDLTSLGPTAVKGITEPIETFRLLSATARPSWEVRSSVSRLNRFVGRSTELAQLSSSLGRALLGRGQVVMIVAEAGFGKSRLVHEFLSSLPVTTWRALRVAAVPQESGVPYRSAAKLLRSLLGVDTTDDPAVVARKLEQTLAVLAGNSKADLAPLQSLLDLAADDQEWLGLHPPERRVRLIAALRRIVLREATVRPLVMVIDDYHWIDQSSLEVLSAIVDGLGAAKLLMVVTSRPDQRPNWGQRSYCLELHLPALEPDSAEVLLREMIDGSGKLDSLREQVMTQAAGVPLYIEELARAVLEGGVVLTDDRLTLSKRVGGANVPASVRTAIAARIDRLPPKARRLLHVASVIGQDVPPKVLQAVADLPDDEFETQLAELQRAEFLYELNYPTGTQYTFKHALIQAVAYEEILRKQRRDLHARVLAAMESEFADRPEQMTERFADHAMLGENWTNAALYALKAGDRAIARWSWREAIAYFDKAIEAIEHLDDSPEKVERSIEARLRLRVALPAAADLPRWVRCLDEARQLAHALGNTSRLAEIDTSKCIALTKMGLLKESIEAGQQGHAASVELDAPALMLNASFALAQAFWYQGNFRESERLLAARMKDVSGELRLAHTGTTGTASVLHLVCLSKTHAMTGQFNKAFDAINEAGRIAEETRRPFDISYCGVGKGFYLLLHDEPLAAVKELETALQLARSNDISLLIPSAMRYLGPAYALTHRLIDANDLLHEAIERTTAHGLLGMRIWSSAALGAVQTSSAAIDKARQTLLNAFELAEQHRFRPVQAIVMRSLGILHEKCGDSETAEQHYRRAILLSDELGMQPELAHARMVLAMLLRRVGRRDEAAKLQASFHDSRRAMGFTTNEAAPKQGIEPRSLPPRPQASHALHR
jgi:class 3 adenylate cyclase/tetratricopeptide (TPR) repeat protein